MSTFDTDVLVLGAGPAGLAVGACLRREGVAFEILEGQDALGASWRGHYDRLHLHTDRDRSRLPHHPWPAGTPRYPSRQQVVEYLESYAARFELRPRFSSKVTRAAREGGAWILEASGARHRARALVVATGLNGVPHRPSFEGEESFRGTVLHSAAYRNGGAFAGRRVLVVGFGNSGGEIAVDLVEHGAAAVRLVVRGPVNVIPKEILGRPILALGIPLAKLPAPLADLVGRPLQRLLVGDLRKLGLQPADVGPRTQIETKRRIPLIDVGTIGMLRDGRLEVRPAIARFTSGGVRFVDGREEDYDAVVLATGFRPRLDAFLSGVPLDEHGGPIHSGRLEGDPPLAFCGFYLSPTGMLREISLEAPRIARALAARLPARGPALAG